MSLRRNLVAGLAASAWSAAIGFAVVPLYLRFLGIEAYGLIGLFSSLQALSSLLDFGLAPAMNREAARATASDDSRPARELLRCLSRIYWIVAAAIALAGGVLAPAIGAHWLQPGTLPERTVHDSLVLMAIVIACRWPVGLYVGVLVGAQRIPVSSAIGMVMSTVSNLGAVVVLALVSASLEAFFLWQAAVGIAYALLMRRAAWNAIGSAEGISFSIAPLRSIWRFSAGLTGTAVLALILTQVDKVILSRTLPLADFGRYSLAALVVSSLYLVITPTFNVVYPRLTALVEAGDRHRVADFYRSSTRIFLLALFPLAMMLAIFSADIVRLWTGNGELGASIGPVIAVLAFGAALHGAMFFPYALQLAHGNTRLPFTINLLLLVIAVPLMSAAAWRYGLMGGASAVLGLFAFYVVIGTWLTARRVSPLSGARWLLGDVLSPLAVSLAVGAVGFVFLLETGATGASRAMVAAVMLAAVIVLSSGLWPNRRRTASETLGDMPA